MPASVLIAMVVINGGWRILLLLPLSLSIAIVYKTTRCESLRALPTAVLALWATIVVGMYAVGVAAWLIFMAFVEWRA